MYKLNFVFPAIAFIAVIASSAQAEVSDITAPGDPMIATSANSPGSEGVLNAIDNTQAKYLNFDRVNTGFTITPRAGMTIVSGLTLTSANDAPDRDPTSYTLEGSYDGVTFLPIANGAVPAFPARFHKNTILFDNNIPFLAYRLIFPTIAGSACCMQITEVELLGVPAPQKDVTAPGDPIIATSANSPGSEGVRNAIDNTQAKYLNFDQVNTGFTVTPSMGSTVVTGISLMSANDAPERDPTSYLLQGSLDGVTFFDISSGPVPKFTARFQKNYVFFMNSHAFMSYRLIFPTIADSPCCMQIGDVELLGVKSELTQDITAPGDPIVATSANSPGSEGVLNAIDNTQAKYLNFDRVNTGFTVTPRAGMTIVSGLTLTSANDAPERDPTSYTLEGSYDGVTFTPIANGVVPAFPARFHKNTILFDNSIPFLAYRLIFPTIGWATCCMQIGEVELLGVPAPQKDVTAPGDPITATSANSPGSEGALNAIDNTQAKYLNFDQLNAGFTVTPSIGSTVVTGISITSANDATERDPTSYMLQGSLDGVTFFDISSGSVPAFSARFQKNFVFFRNPHAFTSYRLIFPTIAGSNCCMQIGEVELLGVPDESVAPAPNQCPTAKSLDITVAQNAQVNFQLLATDQESDPLRYLLSQLPSHGAAALLSVQTGAASYAPTPHFCGVDRLTFKANDNRCGDSNEAVVTIRVTDAEPPSIANVQATPSTLRPGDRHMQTVTINYAVSDSCSGPVSCQLSVSSNEPIAFERRNHSAPDWQIIDAHHVNLRAKRSERGWPRKYTVTVTCSDTAGFSASQDVTVTTPSRSQERDHEREDR